MKRVPGCWVLHECDLCLRACFLLPDVFDCGAMANRMRADGVTSIIRATFRQ